MSSENVLNTYEEMLNLAYTNMPTNVSNRKRFVIPKLSHQIIGRRGPTILYNFKEICDVLNRDPLSILKYLSKELGTPGSMTESRVTFKGIFDIESFNSLISRYVNNFVICPVCKSPDTQITKEKRLRFLKCDACGAKSPVKYI